MSSPPPTPTARPPGRIAAYSLVAGVVCFGVFWAVDDVLVDTPVPNGLQYPASRAAVYATTAEHLFRHYADYEVALKSHPDLSGIEVFGLIQRVSRDMFDETEIDLDVGANPKAVSVTLERSPVPVRESYLEGQSITVICKDMSRSAGQPVGQNCRVTAPPSDR